MVFLNGFKPEVQIDLRWPDSGFVSYNMFISRKDKLFILCSDRASTYFYWKMFHLRFELTISMTYGMTIKILGWS